MILTYSKIVSSQCQCNDRTGFTLIDLMLSLAFMGVVFVIISSGFSLGIKAWQKGEVEAIELQRLRVLSGLMSQQIKSAYPYKILIDSEEVLVFRGTSDSILFVTAAKDRFPGGLKWVSYKYKDGSLLYKEGILPDKELLEVISGDEEEIDSDINEFRFEYLLTDEDGWSETLDFGETLPEAVRVKIGYFQQFTISLQMSAVKGESSDEIVLP